MVERSSSLLGGQATTVTSSSRAGGTLVLCGSLKAVLCLWQAVSSVGEVPWVWVT